MPKDISLRTIIDEVAAEDGFEVLPLPSEYNDHYTTLHPEHPDRCVDDREPVSKKQDYFGAQFPGATFGFIDAPRKVLSWNEDQGREKTLTLYKENNFGIGGHTDDHHGEITDPEELKKRKKGCGNQKVIAANEIEVYKDLEITEKVVDERIDWAAQHGSVIPLTKEHGAIGAVANLVEGTTLDTRAAITANSPMFNGDFAEVYRRAGLLYDQVRPENRSRGEFQAEVTRISVIDYLQTLRALNYTGPLWVRE